MAAEAPASTPPTKAEWFVRFTPGQRLQHLVVMVTFITLAVTGMPQKYPDAGWSQALISLLGGIDLTRLIHRLVGGAFVAACVYHLADVGFRSLVRRQPLTMVPTAKDARDAVAMVRYSLGLVQQPPVFGRYDYRQKFEYWGLWFGGIAMIVSGLVLLYPTWATRVLPGQFVPASRALHSNEALLALLTITVWHMYSAHLSPNVFPFDSSIFTGRISRHRQHEEHPLEPAPTERRAPAANAEPPQEQA